MREVAVRVSQYFRDFLESDFKRQQAPRRRIVLQTEAGFRCGMRIQPYPTLDAEAWAVLNKPSSEQPTIKITPRRHVRTLSPVLARVVHELIAAITPEVVERVGRTWLDEVQRTYLDCAKDPEAWIDTVTAELGAQVAQQIVRPLIGRLDEPLRRQAYSIIDSLYAAETDIVASVTAQANEGLAAVLAKHAVQADIQALIDALATFFTLEGVREALIRFFDGFVTADAYLEFRDLETYAAITEGQQIYLYLGAMKFRSASYPLFFVPVDVTKLPNGEGFLLGMGNQLLANRAAIDFALQELAQAKSREWVSPIQERINYMAPGQSIYEVARGLFQLVANAVDLAGRTEFSRTAAVASTADLSLQPVLHLCAYEHGEEALVNDYEEIIDLARSGGAAIVDLFEGLVKSVLSDNPASISQAVHDEWDGLSLNERMVFDSPIPLNEEQRKVLMAVRNPDGRIVVVEGPPGTGKSHTITAIAADCAFSQRSCLVLSDKAEALEVVQQKLSEAMSRVRHDAEFPNPLLRLGRQDANFKKLVSNQTVNQVSAYARAMRANREQLEAERKGTADDLRESIDKTTATLGGLKVDRIQAFHRAEESLEQHLPGLMAKLLPLAEKILSTPALQVELGLATQGGESMAGYLDVVFAQVEPSALTQAALAARFQRDGFVRWWIDGLKSGQAELLRRFEYLQADQVRIVSSVLLQYKQLRRRLIGYLFRGKEVRALELELNKLPATRPLLLSEQSEALLALVEHLAEIQGRLRVQGLTERMAECYEMTAAGKDPGSGVVGALHALKVLGEVPDVLQALLAKPSEHGRDLGSGGIGKGRLWVLVCAYLSDWVDIHKAFRLAPQFDYAGSKDKLERLNTSVMNAHVDGRLVSFMEEHRADAKTMAALLAQRQKFPQDKFGAVRSSFPVIIASIREFGEYMPLVPELFDVVVIDEASQVSVAQALPAILRAKKVVVLGDSKQFSNVKSSNASVAINEKYRANLVQFFQRNVRADAEALQRLSMFDVKRSILEFCGLASSFTIMLRKHFRSYPELISYSSATFYDHQLQAIKVRGVPIDEVIQFDFVDVTDQAVSRTSNAAEASFIAERLVELLDDAGAEGRVPTVGVITPFREQHTLLTRLLMSHGRGAEFEKRMKLKIMTFDSCQGEERQIIMYSMVATPGNDALNYVFPVALDRASASDTVEEALKMQRLNVGFSRAQEMIWFVHSMPLSAYRGAIGAAMNHFDQTLKRRAAEVGDTDAASPMEAKVLGWLQATRFVQMQPDDVEIVPQFPIGEYLRQLDPSYQHPAWRVDFLVSCRTEKGSVAIVVEYDGFEFHFEHRNEPGRVNVGNHERYLKAGDIERQLTLESYGYRFLRINRFNLGADPVATLDERLKSLMLMAGGERTATTIDKVRKQAEGLVDGDMKVCSRCKEIRKLAAFYDAALKGGEGGHGRICMPCKDADKVQVKSVPPPAYKAYRPKRRRWG
jgi:hypothetical protein